MRASALLPDGKHLRCDGIERSADAVTITVSGTAASACCPSCGRASVRIHSRYERTLADLPWHGVQVTILWRSRKFFCDVTECPRRVFTERLPQMAAPHGRKTTRLQTTLLCLGLACGGEGGARLCERLGIVVSPDALLRGIRSAAISEAEPPRVVGIDDWRSVAANATAPSSAIWNGVVRSNSCRSEVRTSSAIGWPTIRASRSSVATGGTVISRGRPKARQRRCKSQIDGTC